jgi:oxaloacetate decarboxylase (Na+ extruding) subunit alpha
VDLGYPMMITPFSQFIMSEATVNVSTGEPYKVILDPVIEMAIGVHAYDDIGVPWADPNVKDIILGQPNAKILRERYEKTLSIEAEKGSVEKMRAGYGLTNASDKDFMFYHIMKGDREMKEIKPPVTYYTGKEPLVLLLKELSKDHDVRHLSMQKGDTVFEFNQK